MAAVDIADIGFRAQTSDLVDAKAKLEAIIPSAAKVDKALVAVANAANEKAKAVLAAARADQNSSKEQLQAAASAQKKTAADLAAARAASASAAASRLLAAAAGASASATDNATSVSKAAAGAARDEARALNEAAGARRRYNSVPLIPRDKPTVNPWGDTPNLPPQPDNDNVNRAAGSFKANTGNIAAQFQDIGVTAAMGMNPLLIALQQGTQLSAVFAASGETLGATLKAAFLSVISPVALLTIGLVALVAAGLQLVNWTWVAQTGLNAIASILPTVINYLAAAGAILAIAFAPAIAAAIWGIASAITMGLMAAITGIVATIGAIPILLAAVLVGFYTFSDEISQILGFDIAAAAKKGVNYIIGAFVGAFHDIQFLWQQFPNIIGAAVRGAANLAIDAVNAIIQAGVEGINVLIRAVNSITSIGGIGEKLGFGAINEVSFDGLDKFTNNAADKLTEAVKGRNAQLKKDLETDYLGAIGGALDGAARTAADKLRSFSDGLDDPTKKKKKGGGGKSDGAKFSDIVNGAEQTIATLQAERDAIGLSELATARLKYETDLLNQAKEKNIKLTPLMRASIKDLANEMANLEVGTKHASEALEFAKGLTKGFISDFIQGIKDGKTVWESFGAAALNVLQKIGEKLVDIAINKLFESDNGGGGFLGGIFKWLGGLFKNAKGNAFGSSGVENFALGGSFTNSVVDRPTLFTFAKGGSIGQMGEAGPEAIMPLSRGPDGSLGVEMYGGNMGGSSNVNNDVSVTNIYQLSGAVSRDEIVAEIEATAERTSGQVRKSLAGWLQEYDRDGAIV